MSWRVELKKEWNGKGNFRSSHCKSRHAVIHHHAWLNKDIYCLTWTCFVLAAATIWIIDNLLEAILRLILWSMNTALFQGEKWLFLVESPERLFAVIPRQVLRRDVAVRFSEIDFSIINLRCLICREWGISVFATTQMMTLIQLSSSVWAFGGQSERW